MISSYGKMTSSYPHSILISYYSLFSKTIYSTSHLTSPSGYLKVIPNYFLLSKTHLFLCLISSFVLITEKGYIRYPDVRTKTNQQTN